MHPAVSVRVLLAVTAAAGLAVAAGFAWDAGLLAPAPPPPVETPEAVAWGKQLFTQRCLHCHRDVALPPRVAGWTVARAYDAVGRLPQLSPAMPPFRGTDAERRALAAFLSALGGGRAAY
jgi:mono/diheme cytochrome c family protein